MSFKKNKKNSQTSDIPVLLIYGLKNSAMDLCETISIIAFKKRIPWILFMSFGSRSKLNRAFEFLYSENAEYNGAGINNCFCFKLIWLYIWGL